MLIVFSGVFKVSERMRFAVIGLYVHCGNMATVGSPKPAIYPTLIELVEMCLYKQ